MSRSAMFWTAIAILIGASLVWNGSRFIGSKQKARTKEIDFLPPPLVAQALSCGQPTAMAKLRWIDSFAYFQLQLDKQNDRVPGADARGGFERLYETLIALDPDYRPFYEHAVLTTGGVLMQHQVALSFLMRGLIAMPLDPGLWRLASAELAVSYGWTRRRPENLDRWLVAWNDVEQDEAGRQMIVQWRRGLAFANVDGLETLPYWLEQLRGTTPGTPLAEFVEGTVRELLAEHGARELPRLVVGRSFEERVLARSLLPRTSIDLNLDALRARWPKGGPAWAPVYWDGRHAELRSDPFGYPWQCAVDGVISIGREQRRFLSRVQDQRIMLESEANQRGRSPNDAAEARAWGVDLPDPPHGGRWSFEHRLPEVVWPEPPDKPWPLR